jgi:hypothetical protein
MRVWRRRVKYRELNEVNRNKPGRASWRRNRRACKEEKIPIHVAHCSFISSLSVVFWLPLVVAGDGRRITWLYLVEIEI